MSNPEPRKCEKCGFQKLKYEKTCVEEGGKRWQKWSRFKCPKCGWYKDMMKKWL